MKTSRHNVRVAVGRRSLLWVLAAVGLPAAVAIPGRADAPDVGDELRELRRQIQALRQEVRILQRQREIDQEQAVEKAGQQPKVSVGAPNLSFRSPDSKYDLKIRGWVQADSRWFLNPVNTTNGAATPRGDTFLIRRARLVVEGTFLEDFTYFFQPEFGGATATLLDASVNYALRPEFQIKVGRFKSPLGLEFLQSPLQSMGMEWSSVTGLLPLRDNGITLHGDLLDARFSYEVGLFNGGPDGANAGAADIDGTKDVVARVFAQPFRGGNAAWLQGLGFGMAGSWGRREGVAARPSALLSGGSQPIYQVRTDNAVTAPAEPDGAQWRWVPQIYHYQGPLGILAEYVVNSSEYRGGFGHRADQHVRLEHTAWHLDVGYVLTGEDATYRGVRPRHDFSLSGGGWGAVQLFARYSELHLDPTAFPTIANPAYSVSDATEYSAGVNWYLNPNVRVNLHYALTRFNAGDFNGKNRPSEHAVLTRVQISF